MMLMTAITGIFIVCIVMANLAFYLPLTSMIDWELVADKLRWIPIRGEMAIFASEPKITGVDLWLKVTCGTLVRSIFVQVSRMVILATYLFVASIQREEIRMSELMHTIDTVMAFKTFIPVLSLVQADESRVILSMAEGAGRGCEFMHITPMTTDTGERRAGKICPVLFQTEFRLIQVIKILSLKKSRPPGSRIMAG